MYLKILALAYVYEFLRLQQVMVISKNKLLSKEIENLKKLKKVEKRKKKYQIEASDRKGKGCKAI